MQHKSLPLFVSMHRWAWDVMSRKAKQRNILAALAGSPRISAEHAAMLDSTVFTAADVRASLRRAKGSASPGPDGTPLGLFRRNSEVMYPLLARLLTAIMAAGGQLPAGFHNGTIIYLHKAGDRTNPANHRSITLLNTGYRAFMRMLARRLCTALNPVVDRQQSAFLPGRHIGDGILGMQLLPRALAAERSSAVAVFCDFRKAYDTVDRDFLIRLMAALGVPAAFRRVLERLLIGRAPPPPSMASLAHGTTSWLASVRAAPARRLSTSSSAWHSSASSWVAAWA